MPEFDRDAAQCPVCGTSWVGDPIPEALRKDYGVDATHYSRLILIKIWDGSPGIKRYECPDCHTRWDGWIGARISGSAAAAAEVRRLREP
jgi:hypothetical protein